MRLYLDHAATTPILPAARDAMVAAMARWANPSSPHAEGRAARAAVEAARARIAAALDWPHRIIFTSGASEAIGMALGRHVATRVAVSAVEHAAVLRQAPAGATLLRVDAAGSVVLPDRCDDTLVAVQHANNETGVVQPLAAIIAAVRDTGGIAFVDAAQSAGKMPLPDADLIAISAHKFGGPPGIGALLLRDDALLHPVGGQERGQRQGTENLPAIMGMAAALEASRAWLGRAATLRATLDAAIVDAGGAVIAADAERLPTIAGYRMPGVAAAAQLVRFDLDGIAVSAGSACSSGSVKPSHVLAAMGLDADAARETVRVSFGPDTDDAAVARFVESWSKIARR